MRLRKGETAKGAARWRRLSLSCHTGRQLGKQEAHVRSFRRILWALIMMAVALTPTLGHAQQPDPAGVDTALNAALNAGEVDAAVALYTADGTITSAALSGQ